MRSTFGATRVAAAAALALIGCCAGCDGSTGDRGAPPPSTSATTAAPTTPSTGASTGPTSGTPPAHTSPPARTEPRFRVASAMRTVRFLATEVGPREATTRAFERAAEWVGRQFESVGYDVRRQSLRVPAGNSWGVDVPSGETANVVARPPGFDPSRPYRIVTAHLDTVPQAPGAEDDASGIAVILELARMAAAEPPRTQVVFIAFGAEEPRGEGDDLHHFGSTAFVDRLTRGERRQIAAMVSLDRVGVGATVPVCTGGVGTASVQDALVRAGRRADVPTTRCLNTGSDHWTFEKAGIPSARVGGTSYAAYHSAADLPRVENPAQIRRTAALLWAWLSP